MTRPPQTIPEITLFLRSKTLLTRFRCFATAAADAFPSLARDFFYRLQHDDTSVHGANPWTHEVPCSWQRPLLPPFPQLQNPGWKCCGSLVYVGVVVGTGSSISHRYDYKDAHVRKSISSASCVTLSTTLPTARAASQRRSRSDWRRPLSHHQLQSQCQNDRGWLLPNEQHN